MNEPTVDRPSITCPRCRRTSYNPNDVEQRYCGFCHRYLDDQLSLELDEPPTLSPDADAPPRRALLSRLLLGLVGVLYVSSSLLFFVAGKMNASWWWLAFLVPFTLAHLLPRFLRQGGR